MTDNRGVPLLFGASLAVGALLIALVGVGLSGEAKLVKVRDECEMNSFNAFFGAGVCNLDGKVTAEKFLDYITKHQMHPHWRFDPASFNLPAGKQVVLQNLGGEFHTWTKVAEFGGGLIPDLNFGQDARPECFAPDGINNVGIEAGEVEVGATAGSADLPSGTHKFQCCIHPWMQSTVRVN